jgi:hypothetical protein
LIGANSQGFVIVPPCIVDTTYDGVDDNFTTSSSEVNFTGAQTWCAEFYIESSPTTFLNPIFSNVRTDSLGGMALIWDNTSNIFAGIKFDSSGGFRQVDLTSPASPKGVWKTGVIIVTDTSISTWIDGVAHNQSGGSGSHVMGTPNGLFRIGGHRPSWELDGKLRNVEIYSGEASNPTDWEPGNTSSMSGVTLKMQSTEGNGTNGQSISFTTVGDPVTSTC